LGEAVDYVKTELMPDFNFDAFNHDEVAEDASSDEINTNNSAPVVEKSAEASTVAETSSVPDKAAEDVDKW